MLFLYKSLKSYLSGYTHDAVLVHYSLNPEILHYARYAILISLSKK